jgi:arginase family enzyme
MDREIASTEPELGRPEREIVAFLCRTADRTSDGAAGVRELGALLGAREVGSPSPPLVEDWHTDLRDSRDCLIEAGGVVDDALAAGRAPILLAGNGSIAVTTVPTVLLHRPDVCILWLSAHAGFNTPHTTPSGYLGGMSLAAACGLWDAGFDLPRVPPEQVIMHGIRELDGGEQVLLETEDVALVDDPSPLHGLPVYVHLNLDVLDPASLVAGFPAREGLSPAELRRFLESVASGSEVLGAEVTAIPPGHADALPGTLAPLLAR